MFNCLLYFQATAPPSAFYCVLLFLTIPTLRSGRERNGRKNHVTMVRAHGVNGKGKVD